MQARLNTLWVRARDSLWLVPSLLTLLFAAIAVFVVRHDREGRLSLGAEDHWLLGGGAEGARGVLSAIAGGLVTVTGVVFSVTVVALQLASSQYTPRVLRNFTADRSNQLVLGVFIGTFTYRMLVLRTVRSGTPAEEPFIPRVGVAIAVGLVLLSIGFLIFFIDHAARSIQVSVILDRVSRLTIQHIERLFPKTLGRPALEAVDPDPAQHEQGSPVTATHAGYLQAVDARALFGLGERKQLVIRMERHVGEFLFPGQTIAIIWPAAAADDDVVAQIRQAFVAGPERTPEQDAEFGIIEISDIAVKALSPGINDPTTALRCIDRLGEILLALGTRYPPPGRRTREGKIHFIAKHLDFERAVRLAFDQIRHYGADNPMIVQALLDTLTKVENLVPAFRRPPLVAQRELLRG